jgi:hypothetical protein
MVEVWTSKNCTFPFPCLPNASMSAYKTTSLNARSQLWWNRSVINSKIQIVQQVYLIRWFFSRVQAIIIFCLIHLCTCVTCYDHHSLFFLWLVMTISAAYHSNYFVAKGGNNSIAYWLEAPLHTGKNQVQCTDKSSNYLSQNYVDIYIYICGYQKRLQRLY